MARGGVGGGRVVGTARLLDIVAAVWESVMVWGSAQSYRHGGIRRPCPSIHEQCYEERAAAWNSEDSWRVPRHGSVRRDPHSSLHRL